MSTAPVVIEGESHKDEESPGVRTLSQVVGMPAVGMEAGKWTRVFTTEGVHPFDTVSWKITDARITKPNGSIVFEQCDIEVPEWWDQTAVNIVADKYFRVVDGVKERSVKQMFTRVVRTLRRWAEEQDYFASPADAQVYEDELLYALVHQYGAFNSPVWFNLGIPGRRQAASACFISGVDDTLESINAFGMAEKTIFAGGSGSGANLSNIRSSYEKLSSGAYVCGPLGWMEEHDRGAKAMKSGGSTRNAAKMVVLDMDHPDILQTKDGRPGFIRCKAVEEKRAHALIDAGYSAAYDDPNSAYKWVAYQNANHSVSVPDAFMQAVINDGDWQVRARTTGEVVGTYRACDLWAEIAEAAWFCGDPGVQFSDTINRWHTTPGAGRIKASNPCFAAETRIATEYGLISIADLYERVQDGEIRVAVHLGDRVEMRPAVVFPTGMNPILTVKFRSGRELSVTPNHTFLLRDGTKKPAADLVPSDQVDIQCVQGSFGSFDCDLPESTEWFKIAGFVVGDGWMTKGTVRSRQHAEKGWKADHERAEVGMRFGKDDKDILVKVETFLTKQNVPYSLKRQKGSVGESSDYMRIRRLGLFRTMETIACPAGSRSHTKRVQPGVFEASRHNQLAFLSGLISADGTFRMSANGHNGNIPTRELRLSSTSLGLLQDVQALLLNLGVKSTIMRDRNIASRSGKFTYVTSSGEVHTYDSKRALHELFVYGHSLRKLRDDMKEVGGLLSDRKQAQLDDSLPAGYSDPIHDVWHDEVASVEDSGREELTYNMTEFTTHTVIAEGVRIPQCSEFLHVDNTACNLCALNLTRFFDGREFQAARFEHAVRVFVTAQNAIIAKADYPTAAITRNSHALRPIGLNYGDLGALLMKLGFPYDSDPGRAVAGRLASMMTGLAYLVSAKLAARTTPFPDFRKNKAPMLNVMRMHQAENQKLLDKWGMDEDPLGQDVLSRSVKVWEEVLKFGERHGFSISQATLQAPLGTISFLMGMDTTGIEPCFSLVSYKSLVGGGFETLVNRSVRESLRNLGYADSVVSDICAHMINHGHVQGAPGLRDEDVSIFDCAMPSPSGRCVSPIAHLKMMAAIQPLITCAMSKTVNLVSTTTPQEIADIYLESWKLGLKCVALYRDGCKRSQPLATKERSDAQSESKVVVREVVREVAVTKRSPLPEDASATTHRFSIGGYKGYLIVSEYEDGRPGEVFIRFGKNGSTMNGLIDGFTKLLSIALQYGVPAEKVIRSFVHTKFEPSGITTNPRIRLAESLYDYLFKYLDVKYFKGVNSGLDVQTYGLEDDDSEPPRPASAPPAASQERLSLDGPPCGSCGTITQRNGSCYLCKTCGATTGCS